MQRAQYNRRASLKTLIVAAVMSLLLAAGIALASTPQKSYAAETPDNYTAQITVANYGTITVELNRKAAPITVENFVKLAREGFYNGTDFHRIVNGFMIQGGAYNGTDENKKPTEIKGEFSANGWSNPISHTRGVISMARANDYNSASSQFFIVHKDSTFLDPNYAAFGHVVSGMNVVDSIANTTVTPLLNSDGSIAEYSVPVNKPVITSIKITDGVSTTGWQKTGSRWWYKYDSVTAKTMGKTYPKNETILIDGKSYEFDNAGWMKTGWQKSGSSYYYLDNSTGQKKTGWVKSGSKWYYLDPSNYLMVTNPQKTIDGKTYAFDSNGAMRTGWFQKDGKWYYCDNSGVMKKGWFKSGKTWYYLNPSNGEMTSNASVEVSGKKYFFNTSGAMETGWLKKSAVWYYCNSSGAMQTGWVKSGGKWYYLDETKGSEGIMQVDKWITLNKQVYCLDKNGVMMTGWHYIDGSWYYFNGSGQMQTNKWVNGIYWVNDKGEMATNTWVDNDQYYVDANGKYVKNKVKD